MAFVVLKELMQAIPHQEVAQTSQVYMEEGVHLLVSHTTQLAMEGESVAASVTPEESLTRVAPPRVAVYHLTLTAAPKEYGHLVGEYKVTVDRTSLHLAGKGAGQTWCWRLEDIRRFSVQEKDTQMVFVIGRCVETGWGGAGQPTECKFLFVLHSSGELASERASLCSVGTSSASWASS